MPSDDEGGVTDFDVRGPAAGSTGAVSVGAVASRRLSGPGYLSELTLAARPAAAGSASAANAGRVRVEFQLSEQTAFTTQKARWRFACYLGPGEDAVLHPNIRIRSGEQLTLAVRVRARDNSWSGAQAVVDVVSRVSQRPVAGAERADTEGWYYRAVASADPAAGSDATYTQPDGLESEVLAAFVTLVASGVASRVLTLVFTIDSLAFEHTAQLVQTDGQTREYTFIAGTDFLSTVATTVVFNTEVKCGIGKYTLKPGDTAETAVLNFQAGDNFTALRLFTRERIVPLSAS